MTVATSDVARVNGITMHYLRAGDGPPLVLLHGWPQTSHCWRYVLPELARTHTVIAPDLRGYGRTDKPVGGYDKRTMAADVAALLEHLGGGPAVVVGHDRGARVAHRWALDRPEQVDRLVLLDIIPTREMWRRMDVTLAGQTFHWLFHLQPDLPERLVGQDVAGYLAHFLHHGAVNRAGLPAEAVDEYVRAFSQPGALRAGFDDYRAAPVDGEHDDADAAAGRRLAMPLLVLWGAGSFVAAQPVLEIWREYADDVRGEAVETCGHYIAEERPDVLLARLGDHLRPGG